MRAGSSADLFSGSKAYYPARSGLDRTYDVRRRHLVSVLDLDNGCSFRRVNRWRAWRPTHGVPEGAQRSDWPLPAETTLLISLYTMSIRPGSDEQTVRKPLADRIRMEMVEPRRIELLTS